MSEGIDIIVSVFFTSCKKRWTVFNPNTRFCKYFFWTTKYRTRNIECRSTPFIICHACGVIRYSMFWGDYKNSQKYLLCHVHTRTSAMRKKKTLSPPFKQIIFTTRSVCLIKPGTMSLDLDKQLSLWILTTHKKRLLKKWVKIKNTLQPKNLLWE